MLQGLMNNSAAPPVAQPPLQQSSQLAVDASTKVSGNSQGASDPSTAPKFGDILNKIQAQYGAKEQKPREIKKTLGKDDFLRIMITQMQHQDPTSPFKADQMAAQMAQFASVEQMQNMNIQLKKMAEQSKPAEHLAMANLIGKVVTVDRGRFPHTQGSSESLSYTLPKNATSVRAVIIDGNGETVMEKDLGAQKTGEASFSWDGHKANTLLAKTGEYILRIEAKDDHGQTIETNPERRARVIGISFGGPEPVLLVGDNKHQDHVELKSVTKIESDGGMGAGMPLAQNQAGASAGPQFFAFKKGEGSSNLNPATLPPEVAKALAHYGTQKPDAPIPPSEKGFPNGLHE